ncbi:LCP family protein [Amnibacterium sp. CER49]|uniref:LCP family protein n=1 Tax=Amnibacterium sp. CER49 TaxID=3039161 RepID=UPI002447FE58|nr:LCP family protein [Amnibacterium sp. CER49]MDH2443087.1 LCP family protein [Amnibacterium sp. CER49]
MTATGTRWTAGAPPRPSGRGATRAMLRDPDPLNVPLMTRRAWWLAVLHLLIPGAPQALAGNRRLGRFALGVWLAFWIAALAGVVLWFLLPQVPLTVFTNVVGLTVLQVLLGGWAVLEVVLTVSTFRLLRLVRVRPVARVGTALLLVVGLVIGVGGGAWGAYAAGIARGTIGSVFGSGRYALPENGRYNILLLGGDAGPGRLGLRPDSISVVSLDALTGKMVQLGLPREMNDIPFAPGSPMLKKYPNGYGHADHCDVDVCQLNSIYTEVQLKYPGLYPDATKQFSKPGIEATRDAVEGALGIRIQYYVLVDMESFGRLIDAMGGVTVDVKQRIPIGGHMVNGTLTGVKVWIEPGRKRLNGNRALWYARSRYGDAQGDYGRMARQRELETAMLHQMNPITLLTRFDKIAKAGALAVDTDIPQGLLGEIAGLAVKARTQKETTIEFVPPRVQDVLHPDWTAIHRTVQAALR